MLKQILDNTLYIIIGLMFLVALLSGAIMLTTLCVDAITGINIIDSFIKPYFN